MADSALFGALAAARSPKEQRRLTQINLLRSDSVSNGAQPNHKAARCTVYKTILVPWVNQDTDRGALPTAMALAEAFSAHLVALVTVDMPPPMPNEWGVITNDYFLKALDESRERAKAVATRLGHSSMHLTHPIEVRMIESVSLYPARTACLNARYADLTIIPSAPLEGAESALSHSYFQELINGSGGPVMVVPPGAHKAPMARVAIAWQPTREAARAVHDALPLLKMAKQVDVVMVDPSVGEGNHGEQPGADIAAYLARHGLAVEVFSIARQGRTVTFALLDHVREHGVELIVAGGYGHSRLRELILGGVTRDLLTYTTVPVLFSH